MANKKSYYPYYEPSVAAAGLLCAVFSIGFIISLFQTIRHKAKIWAIMLLAIAMEAVGYGFRIYSARHVGGRTVYIIQFCLIVLAPVLMAGIVYVVFGRIVFLVVPPESRTIRLLWVPARWLTPIFVGFDIFALLLQLVGAVMITGSQPTDTDYQDKISRGRDIALAGVTTQIIAFGLFSILAIRFHVVSRRFITGDTPHRFDLRKWRSLLYAVNFSCAMILIRSIYREVEFALGPDGYTSKYEYCQYVFDALPIVSLVIVYTIVPPGAHVTMGFRQQRTPKSEQSVRDEDGYRMDAIA